MNKLFPIVLAALTMTAGTAFAAESKEPEYNLARREALEKEAAKNPVEELSAAEKKAIEEANMTPTQRGKFYAYLTSIGVDPFEAPAEDSRSEEEIRISEFNSMSEVQRLKFLDYLNKTGQLN